MIMSMKRNKIQMLLLGFFGVLLAGRGMAQDNTYHSVLSEHTWYRIAVTQEGIHKLDYATLQAMGIDMDALNPLQIRLFGNPSGALPEKNSEARPDDLTEMALLVEGADDGVFDSGDVVLFYGQEPTRWTLVDNGNETYRREANPYSDTTYYYLCVDSGEDGLRVGERASLPVEGATAVIADFPDFFWHEVDLYSPYASGLNWLGERMTVADSLITVPFSFANLVTDKALTVKGQVLGHFKQGHPVRYTVKVADNILINNVNMPSPGNYDYGKLVSFSKQCMVDTEASSVDFSIESDPESIFFLDYVEVYAWRQLKRVGDNFLFRLMPSQFGNDVSAVWVQNATANHWLWDVSDPLRPVRQNGVLSANNLVFATDEVAEKRYALFRPAAAMPIASWTAIPNQNLHAIADADMLIITSPVFMAQAQTLADYHATKDGLTSVVVNVEEIYNEFSNGTPDPSGIRDFVRMVYRRSGANLKYLTLFGRASYDFRNLLGYGKNFVPTYQTKTENPLAETDFCADDYYGLMDDTEGSNCQGRVDLGIGRLPVSTVDEAETVLRKIFLYDDMARMHGDWKADYLLMADDEVSSYISNCETYHLMTDTACAVLTPKKVYCGAYQHVTTNSGVTIPGANADVVRAINQGLLAMLYTGHGGVRGLTGDNVFTNSDIVGLTNADRLPFVFTATCEFSKYDNPILVSAGEHMFLNPNGGSVAMFTTCRSTYGPQNLKQGKALMKVLYQRDREGKPQRFGDIVRKAKIDPLNFVGTSGLSENIRFVFLGDPAQRFALPLQQVEVTKVNGIGIDNESISLHAMSMVTVEGSIMAEGLVDTQFNGEVWVRFYDKKTKVVVPTAGNQSVTTYYHKDVLYRGCASVNNGKFTVAFQVPKDIKVGTDVARFSFYAYDSIRGVDAAGSFDGITLGGTDPAALADDEGPTIRFYWNTPEFESGQSVEREGVLCADLYDAQGIYHYDFSLGRDIMLSSNLSAYNRLVLNERYEPVPNDFRRGRVTIPVSDLEPGTYEFTLKVWDTQDNPSEASLWFVVDDDLFLSQVYNYPNPFSDATYITMTHLGEDGNFDVDVEVFDVMGRRVAQLSQRVSATNGVIEPIRWDANNALGGALRSGVYLYRLTLTDESGFSRTVCQRMLIQR